MENTTFAILSPVFLRIGESQEHIVVPCASKDRRDEAMSVMRRVVTPKLEFFPSHTSDGLAELENGSRILFWIIRPQYAAIGRPAASRRLGDHR